MKEPKEKVSFSCPVCGKITSASLKQLKEDNYIDCLVCGAKHEGNVLREKLKQEIEEFEKDYIDYAKNVEL